ncbi:MAG TPA: pitrilysin family protein [Armatimonadota bacterium]|nr:pitrilysin family protein [Armatimonadota bacterium]
MTAIDFWTLLVVGALLLTASTSAGAAPGDVQQRTLPNGLEVLVQEDHSAPLVCSFIWYRVGLRHEPTGEAGISHFLEHMAFKGTERLSGREMNRLVTAKGGYLNGFTSMDYTAYVETLPSDSLDLGFDIESERMLKCLLSAEDIEAEKGVVISEFEGAENDPAFLLRRRVMAEQFPGQPYGRSVIGEKDDLRSLTKETVLSYYKNHYAPNNAVLVVVGDIDAEAAFTKAEHYFGSLPSDNPVPPAPNPGRGPTGERRVTLEVPGRTPYFQAVYGVPPIQHPDHVALEVFQNIVSSGRTSRLYPALVHSGLASSAGGWQYENPEPTVFAFEVAMQPGVEHQAVEDVLDGIIERLKDEPVGETELLKAKNKTKANFIYSADGVSKLAQQIGYYHLIYTHEYLSTFPEKVDAVTADDIRRVVTEYLTKDNRTVGWLIPTGEPGGGAAPGGAAPVDVQWQHRPDLPPPADAADTLLPPPAGLGTVAPIHQVQLDNGLSVVMQENHAAPFVALYGNIIAGPVLDPQGKAGVAAFTAEMISRGTQKRSWHEIREELETVAAELMFGTGAQVATVGGRSLKDDLGLLLTSAAEQLTLPAFPDDEIEKVRSELIAAQQRRDEDTQQIAEKELFAHLYPEGHPFHDPRLGTAESVSSITRDDLAAFHSRYYRPENTILAIVGDIDPEEAARLIQGAFAAWEKKGDPAKPDLPQVPVSPEPQTITVTVPNKTQVDIALGFPGIARRDPRYYQADLMNYVLGRSFMSRLNMHIREQLGLAYYVYSLYYAYWGPGPWVLHMGVNPANAEKATKAALEELQRIQEEPPSEEELQLWKDYVKGTVARRMETYAGIAQELVLARFYDLGPYHAYEYPGILAGITAAEVHEAAKAFLHPTGYVAVIAGPAAESPEP